MTRFGFPISLDVWEKRCLVLGGGFEATDKAKKLVAAGAKVQVIAAEVEDELSAMSARGELSWAARDWEQDDVRGVFLVMLTPDDGERAVELYRLATIHGFLLCSIDQPELCHFASPATFHAGEVTFALSSGGRAPAVLRRLREDLEAALGTEEMADFVAAMAKLRDETPKGERAEKLRAMVEGFRVTASATFPAWFRGRDRAGT